MEHTMRITRDLLIWSLITLIVTLFIIRLNAVSLRYGAVLSNLTGREVPAYIQAGVPFTTHDNYATQMCISTRSGQLLSPFVTPPGQSGAVAPAHVQAWVPFMVHDRHGTQICISTRGGDTFPPFVAP
jgi:hypothetical protein